MGSLQVMNEGCPLSHEVNLINAGVVIRITVNLVY